MLFPKEERTSFYDQDILNVRVPVEPWGNGVFHHHGNTRDISGDFGEDLRLDLSEPTHESVMRLKWSKMITDLPTTSTLTLDTSKVLTNEGIDDLQVQAVQDVKTGGTFDGEGWMIVDEQPED
ncbi:uncharacterized protein L199_003639 [Kwoniella botswanensis]|uniref:uncharacterized protein n=1 Tax=Kwoniella botswanensis TaxID=1268659 RepID=UPI00315D93A6